MAIKQPLTAKQIGKKTGIPADTCSYVVAKFTAMGLFTCLNPEARNSRLYWLTETGFMYQKRLCDDSNIICKYHDFPSVNWGTYGWSCYNHRSIVIKTLNGPMQPAEIKKILRVHKPNVKISANNIRDVIKLLLAKGIVQPVKICKKAHLRYELTDLGNKLKQLLIKSESIF